MKITTLQELYIHELKDLYSAETQIIKALPKMIEAASHEELAEGFTAHLAETKEHIKRLEKILSGHEETTQGPKCKGMEGVLEEGKEMIELDAEDELKDAGLIIAAQRVEHYEIAGYGSALAHATLLDDSTGIELLELTLEEEVAADEKLSELAEESINEAAGNVEP